MEDLFIWYRTNVRGTKGIPQDEDIWIRENFSYGKEIEGLKYEWVDYDYDEHGFPPNGQFKLPEELFFIVQRVTSLNFDFLPYRKNIFIVSKEFKLFLTIQQKDGLFEFSKLNVVHKKNKQITSTKEYYLLRVITFDDDCFDFIEEGKKRANGLRGEFIYPNLMLKENISHGIFFLDSFCYREAVVFTGKIKDEVKSLFYSPEIYRINDFHLAFNNRNKETGDLPETV